MNNTVQVLNDTVLIRHVADPNRKGNGLITAVDASDRGSSLAQGEIVGLGDGDLGGGKRIESALALGDKVAYVRTSAYTVTLADEQLDVVSFFDVKIVITPAPASAA